MSSPIDIGSLLQSFTPLLSLIVVMFLVKSLIGTLTQTFRGAG